MYHTRPDENKVHAFGHPNLKDSILRTTRQAKRIWHLSMGEERGWFRRGDGQCTWASLLNPHTVTKACRWYRALSELWRAGVIVLEMVSMGSCDAPGMACDAPGMETSSTAQRATSWALKFACVPFAKFRFPILFLPFREPEPGHYPKTPEQKSRASCRNPRSDQHRRQIARSHYPKGRS